MDKQEIFDKCIKFWGVEANIKQLIEEMAELAVAVCHFPRGKASKQDVLTELVDVQMMIDISRDIYGISKEEFDKEFEIKLQKVEKLLIKK